MPGRISAFRERSKKGHGDQPAGAGAMSGALRPWMHHLYTSTAETTCCRGILVGFQILGRHGFSMTVTFREVVTGWPSGPLAVNRISLSVTSGASSSAFNV